MEPDRLASLRRVATIESVASSTRIEGAIVSDEEVEKILSGLSIDSFRARDEAEVRGYGDLLMFIFDNADSLRLTENHLKQMHAILLAHVPKDTTHRGEYKRIPNDVVATRPDGTTRVIFRPASPADTILMMPRLLEETRAALDVGEVSSIAVIADLVLCFLAVHPFQDGNGRLSRALTTLLLLQAGHDYVPYGNYWYWGYTPIRGPASLKRTRQELVPIPRPRAVIKTCAYDSGSDDSSEAAMTRSRFASRSRSRKR